MEMKTMKEVARGNCKTKLNKSDKNYGFFGFFIWADLS